MNDNDTHKGNHSKIKGIIKESQERKRKDRDNHNKGSGEE